MPIRADLSAIEDLLSPAPSTIGLARIHPWLHVDKQAGVILGRVTDAGKVQLVTSGQIVYDPEQVKDRLTSLPRTYPDLVGRWPDRDAEAFLTDGTAPALAEVLALLIHELRAAVEFPREEHAALVAVWGIATYFHRLFLAFPRLQLVGERGCGKSKVLTLLQAVAWNASLALAPTPAVLYRLVQETRPTFLLDECEALNKEDRPDILAIVNSGYKHGASVPRCEGEKTKRVEFFEVYAPLALASIRGLNATTEDRAISLVMQKGTNQGRINAEVDPSALAFTRIRNGCYRLLLTRWRDVAQAYQLVTFPSWLNARTRELWKPLLAVAHVADQENGLAITPDLHALAKEHVEDRTDLSAEGAALLAVLAQRLKGAECVTIRPGELAEDLREHLGWRAAPTPERIGTWLRRLGFRRTGKDGEGAKYEVRADQLSEVTTRFTPPETFTPSPSPAN